MRLLRLAVPILLVMLFVASGSARPLTSGADYTPPDAPPPEFQAQFDELTQELAAFDTQLDASWDGSLTDGQFAGAIQASANPNLTVALLSAQTWTRTVSLLDAYEAMGVQTIKIDLNYPTLTPAFHTYLQAHPPAAVPNYTYIAANFIGYPNSFYNKLVTEIRSRGMKVWIEHGTLFSDYSPTPATDYFADMRTAGLAATQTRFEQERIAESVAIIQQLQPDYYTILEEPGTADMNFGYFPGNVPIFDVSGWTQLVSDTISAIRAQAPGSATKLGAGTGVWDSDPYLTTLTALSDLDYFDIHIYPLKSLTADYLQRTLTWIDYVQATDPNKFVMMGEVWTYKTTGAEISGGADYQEVYGRDVYSFWEPIDRQFLDVLYKLMHWKHVQGIMPYWAQYYFAYLTYGDPALDGLSGIQLTGAGSAAAQANWPTVTLTGTGERFEELLANADDVDSDGFVDAHDTCPAWANPTQALPNWNVPAGDSDCDGYPDSVQVGLIAGESTIGTDAGSHCAATSGTNDEVLPDAWPPDFNDNQLVNVGDLLAFNLPFSRHTTDPPVVFAGTLTPISRFDLNGSGLVNVSDVLQLNPFMFKRCDS